jgi:hypothetical protein
MRRDRTICNSLFEQDCPDRSFGRRVSSLDFYGLDERLPRLMILLRQLEKSLTGLETIPEISLSEIVHSAIHLCGFVDPTEAEYTIEVVLEILEARSVILEATFQQERTAPS